jgi:NTE family protein
VLDALQQKDQIEAMSEADPRHDRASMPLPAQVALVLQGGIAEALNEASIPVDWVAGISIGAINAALIAGNPPERRVERLKAFWATVTGALPSFPIPFATDQLREMLNEWSAGVVATAGVPGFFSPRMWPPVMAIPGTIEALSFYDTAPLTETLNGLIDWDLLNTGPVRLAVGAVEIESGNFRFFDTHDTRDHRKTWIDHRHIMASGALPPGLPPVEIDGKWYWDGGIVSNTPLSHVLDNQEEDMLIFQVDLFSSKGPMPKTMMDVAARAKEIQYSSRTRNISDQMMQVRKKREVASRVLAKLPPELHDDPDVKELTAIAHENAVALVQLIYRASSWESGSRDYEFSERTRVEHWEAGRKAIARTIGKAGVIAHDIVGRHTVVFDTNRPD